MLERLAGLIRSSRDGDAPKAKKADAKQSEEGTSSPPPEPSAPPAGPVETPALADAADVASDESKETQGAPEQPPQGALPQTPATETVETPPSPAPDAASAEAASTADSEPDKKAPRLLPQGCFETTADMMSLVGCSGEEFEGILKSLGYRKRPHTVDGGEEPVQIEVWFYQQRRPARQKPHRKDAAGKSDGPRLERNSGTAKSPVDKVGRTSASLGLRRPGRGVRKRRWIQTVRSRLLRRCAMPVNPENNLAECQAIRPQKSVKPCVSTNGFGTLDFSRHGHLPLNSSKAVRSVAPRKCRRMRTLSA